MGRARDTRLAYLLLAPALLLLLTAFAYPIGWEVWTSFTDLSPLKVDVAIFGGDITADVILSIALIVGGIILTLRAR